MKMAEHTSCKFRLDRLMSLHPFFTNVAKWNVDTNGEKDKIIVNFEYQEIYYNQINKSASVRFLRNQIVRV